MVGCSSIICCYGYGLWRNVFKTALKHLIAAHKDDCEAERNKNKVNI